MPPSPLGAVKHVRRSPLKQGRRLRVPTGSCPKDIESVVACGPGDLIDWVRPSLPVFHSTVQTLQSVRAEVSGVNAQNWHQERHTICARLGLATFGALLMGAPTVANECWHSRLHLSPDIQTAAYRDS